MYRNCTLPVLVLACALLLSALLLVHPAAAQSPDSPSMPYLQHAPQTVSNGSMLAPGDENWDGRFGSNGTNGVIHAIATQGNDLYVAGRFTQAGGVSANHVARYNSISGRWYPLGSGLGGTDYAYATAIAVHGNEVYVGGNFSTAGGVSATRVATWNRSTEQWYPLGGGFEIEFVGISAIAVQGRDVYVGGRFDYAGGVSASNIARWSNDTNQWYPLGWGVNGHQDIASVRVIRVEGSDVYVGGKFDRPGLNIARWNSESQQWYRDDWGVTDTGGYDAYVSALAVSGSDVFVGGYFSVARVRYDELRVHNIARWNYDTDRWYDMGGGMPGGYNQHRVVNALVTKGREVFATGQFGTAGGQIVNGIAGWDTETERWYPLGSGLGGTGWSLLVHRNDLYVGGGFTTAGNKPSFNLGLWHIPPTRE